MSCSCSTAAPQLLQLCWAAAFAGKHTTANFAAAAAASTAANGAVGAGACPAALRDVLLSPCTSDSDNKHAPRARLRPALILTTMVACHLSASSFSHGWAAAMQRDSASMHRRRKLLACATQRCKAVDNDAFTARCMHGVLAQRGHVVSSLQ